MQKCIVSTCLLALGLAFASFAGADSAGMRCGSKLVNPGDSRASVRAKCGEPVDITHQTLFERPSIVRHGRVYFLGDQLVQVEVENWTYNLGPNKFMRRVRFVNGIVEDVESLDYGYHE